MKGIQFVTDDFGKRTAVLIDLKEVGEIWKDIYDILVSKSRKHEATIPCKKLKAEMRQKGTPMLTDRITIDPEIFHRKPCVRGLRYPVEVFLKLLSSGMIIDEIHADYEDLECKDLLAILAYSA